MASDPGPTRDHEAALARDRNSSGRVIDGSNGQRDDVRHSTMGKTYSYLTHGDQIARTVHDVERVKIRRGSVILLGRKDTTLMVFPEHTMIALWRSVETKGDRYVISLQSHQPVEVGGVKGIDSERDKLGRPSSMILEAKDDDLPAAVVSANQVRSIRQQASGASQPRIGPLTLAQHPSGGLLLVALDPTAGTEAPNVFGQTMDPAGNWLDREPLGTQHLTDVAATTTAANIRLFGCNDAMPGPNIFHADYTPSNTTWEPLRDGILTTISAAVLADGRVMVAGLNAALSAPGHNCFVAYDPVPAQPNWAGVDVQAIDITCATSDDGALAVITVTREGTQRLVTTVHSAERTGWQWTLTDLNRDLTSLTATRAADGRINVFGIAANSWSGGLDDFVQESPDTWEGTWSTTRISLRSIVSATALDGRMHLVGLTDAGHQTGELLHRHETAPGGPWSHWTAIG